MFVLSQDAREKRVQFLRFVFGESEGFIRIAFRDPHTKVFREEFLKWPEEVDRLKVVIESRYLENVYFSPMLFRARKGNKENVILCPAAWADLDSCNPDKLLVPPSFEIESSPDRWQALWLFKEPLAPSDAEDISRRIAHAHEADGADKSGWDLTQLLRFPFTNNYKYGQIPDVPLVRIVRARPDRYTFESFGEYPDVKGFEYASVPLPTPEMLVSYGDSDDVLMKHRHEVHQFVWGLYQQTPAEDWSSPLWKLQMLLFESGLTREEVFVVAKGAACNKYERDGRADTLLWREVCRAESNFESKSALVVDLTSRDIPALLSEIDHLGVDGDLSIIDEYIEWASSTGDAAPAYHEAGAFIILSSLLAGSVRLPTSFGTLIPNLWFMILADTTLTRKTTAMDLAMDIITEIDSSTILATDGSIEGLFTSLSMRPGRPSIFLRDEFTGLMEAISRKEYYAGMAETLTKMYDGKFQRRVLRKEIIEVRDPILILFAGGIRSRMTQLLNHEHIASGFIPRFVVISAESNVSTMRPLGPPTIESIKKRQELIDKFRAIAVRFQKTSTITVGGATAVAKNWAECSLSQDAWTKYNNYEADMLSTALTSSQRELLTPCFDRMCKSGLKVAVLIAAARTLEGRKIVIEERDIVKAFSYVERWRNHTVQLLRDIGKSSLERQIDQVMRAIQRHPGILRSALMSSYHLTKRDADIVLDTLDQRGMITRMRSGKTERLYPVSREEAFA